MTLVQIQQVVEIANSKSISRAAEKLYISQPNLSSSIRHLEEELGISIFKRTNQGTELTDFGAQFVPRCRNILTEVDEIKSFSDTFNVIVPLELKVGSIGLRFVNEVVGNIYNKFSNNPLNVCVNESNLSDLVDATVTGKIEIGFLSIYDYNHRAMLRHINMSGLDYYKLCDATAGVYVSPNSRIFKDCGNYVDLQLLEKSVFVCYVNRDENKNMYFGIPFKTIEESTGVKVNTPRKINVDNPGLMRHYVNALDGFALATYCDHIYSDIPFYDSLRFIPFAPGTMNCEVGYIQRHNTPRSVLADELIKQLVRINIK